MVDILNATLGYQEIQVVSMPERIDKRDAFAVMASVTGIDYNITDGVVGDTISAKALPHTMQQEPKTLAAGEPT
ncbi:uncharacterized protein AB675_351 [Cyphellophora attinorum]|uniref:Uncharacterized protein n=1 Tax=Cyphellophora attinorum TaxID=1664694 RepID=A0A0N0NS50_9EURO|nr:uncharacterized protein AB675_351 [Phialophora attinorum]KPI45848.1 hypothetical protein AB675_351 [Phialophora attinorum]